MYDKVISVPEEGFFCFVFPGVECAISNITDKVCLSLLSEES